MSAEDQRFAEAQAHLRNGQEEEAQALCRALLKDTPEHGGALHLLGMILLKQGQLEGAESHFRRAIEASPLVAAPHHNLAILLRSTGCLEAAAEHFGQALELRPDHKDARYNLGLTLRALGRLEQSETTLRMLLDSDSTHFKGRFQLVLLLHSNGQLAKALEVLEPCLEQRPTDGAALLLKAKLLLQLDRLTEAEAFAERGLEVDPDHAEAFNGLGSILREQGRLAEARNAFMKALEIDDTCADAHSNLATLCRDLGQLDEAAKGLRCAIALNPENAAYYNNIGLVYRDLGLGKEAIEALQEALRLNPGYPEALNNLGATYRAVGRLGDAVIASQKALKLKPDFANGWNNLAGALLDQGRLEEAIAAYRQAVQLRPDLCMPHSNLLMALHYDPSYGAEEILAESRQWEVGKATLTVARVEDYANIREPDRKLRIGYLSPDFRKHSVSYFFQPILAAHDRSDFEIHGYGEVAKPDAVTDCIREQCNAWCFTQGLTNQDLAKRIRDDRIDILVDLAGHTARTRIAALASRPAPLQINWLGHPGTTGFSAIGYRLTDDVADPVGVTDAFHSEVLLRLANFLCYGPPQDAPPVAALPAAETACVTFGSFNNLAKVTEDVVRVWCAILKRLPQARLVIKAKPLADTTVKNRFCALFETQGIDASRVDLLSWISSTAGHLGAYGQIDIGLDPFPYNGTTTTCEALWMGVPVITLQGAHHAARVGASLLDTVGLDAMICASESEYIERAVALASDMDRLLALRHGLRQQVAQSPLCDAPTFTRALEQLYRDLWQRWCESKGGAEAPR